MIVILIYYLQSMNLQTIIVLCCAKIMVILKTKKMRCVVIGLPHDLVLPFGMCIAIGNYLA